MLTKRDLELIDKIVGRRIQQDVPGIVKKEISSSVPKMIRTEIKASVPGMIGSAFEDFYDSIFEPFATRTEDRHVEIIKKFKENDEDHELMLRKLDRNREEHDEIFEDMVKINLKIAS